MFFFLRIGFLFQAAFWILLVSFALTGGDPKAAERAEGPMAPARQTAAKVVEFVYSLRHFCDDHEKLCRQAHSTSASLSHWTGEITKGLGGAWDWSRGRFDGIARTD